MGDDGYYLYISIDAGDWDYSTTLSFIYSFWRNPGGHSWIILESPQNRVEYGHNGNFGLERPRYQENVYQRFLDHHPDPFAYLWEMMSDGRLEIGRPDRTPTFVWRMPITKRRHQSIHDYVMSRTYDQFGVRKNNCVDMVTDAAALAGINLIHRLRLTIPKNMPVSKHSRLDGPPIPHPGVQHAGCAAAGPAPACPVRNRERCHRVVSGFEAVTMQEGRSLTIETLRTGGVSAARQSSSRNRRQTFAMLKAAEPF